MTLIEEIIDLEWKDIEELKASKEKKKTFEIMRQSQFELWSNDLLQSYLDDLKKAKFRGWSLVTEKYARILEYTDFVQYQNILHMIPEVSDDSKDVIDMVVMLEGLWLKQFEKNYPRLAKTAKEIEVYEDQEKNITFEQGLKCELLTYSANTLMLYAQMIIRFKKGNRNYIKEMMENACKHYNFVMIDEAERDLVD